MDGYQLISMFSSVTKSEVYFRHLKWQGRRQCPWCKCRKIYRLSGGKFKCSKCRKLFTEFSGTYLSGIKIPLNHFVYLLDMFVLGVPVYRLLKRSSFSRSTIQRIFRLFRQAIYNNSLSELKQLSGSLELDEAMFGGYRPGKRGWGAEGKSIVFGMYQRNGRVIVFPVSNRRRETLEPIIKKHTKIGSIYYTDEYEGYVSLVVRGKHIRVKKEKGKPVGEDHINGMEGFWSYAKTWLYHYRGVPRNYFHFYLKEIEFRFNNRDKDLFDEMSKLLVNLVSKS